MANNLSKYIETSHIKNSNIEGSLDKTAQFDTYDKVYIEHLDYNKNGSVSEFRCAGATDYAVLCGACVWKWDKDKKPRADVLCRTMINNDGISGIGIFSDKGDFFESDYDEETDNSACIAPCINIDLNQALRDGVIIGPIEYVNIKNSWFRSIQLGEYPQTHINHKDRLHEELNRAFETWEKYPNRTSFRPTGKSYPAYYDNIEKFKTNDEYYYKGNKYVRTKHHLFDDDSKGGYGWENNDYSWVKVEPIEWLIKNNWDDMPTELNPAGSGKDKVVNLRSLKLIISGLPFNPNPLEE